MLAENEPFDVRPRFLKSVGSHASGETFRRAQERVLHIGFAVNAPGVRKEVIPENRYAAGKGGPEAIVASANSKREPYHISDASLKGPARHAKIAGILVEDTADTRFNGISRSDSGHAHSIAIGKASPAWPIL